jgi:hypothetical protein
VRRHAKAPTARSTKRQASGLGRFLRGALATRGVSSGVDGSGASPSGRRHARWAFSAACLALIGGAFAATAPAAAPPTISGEAAREVGPTTVKLIAQVNPQGEATTYHAEYGATLAYGGKAPLPDANAGSDAVDHQVTAQLSGLQPGTRYHWRMVAENGSGVTEGGDHAFTTFEAPQGPGSSLPDNRAWEQVTPQDKNGADLGNIFAGELALPGLKDTSLRVTGVSLHSSLDGNRIEFATNRGAFANPKTSGLFGQYLSDRSSTAWTTQSLDPPYIPVGGLLGQPIWEGFNSTLTKAIFYNPLDQAPLSADAPFPQGVPVGVGQYYVYDVATGTFRYVMSDGQKNSGHSPEFIGVSDDFKHVVQRVEKEAGANGFAPPSAYEGYENGAGEFETRNVTVLPDTTEVGGNVGSNGPEAPTEHAISPDGSRIVFNDRNSANVNTCVVGEEARVARYSCGNPQPKPNLYVRENGTSSRLISDYAPGVPVDAEAGTGQRFQGADKAVTKIFFTSQTKLTLDSNASHESGDDFSTGSHGDLYRYDLNANGGAGELIDVTPDATDAEGAQVIGVLGNSDDGNRIYFVARSNQLDGEQGIDGQANLYLWSYNGGSPTTTYVATLQAPVSEEDIGDITNWSIDPYKRSSEVTPDGSHIVFTSKNKLSGFDNNGYTEVYAYDASAGQLRCASCTGDEPATQDAFVPFGLLLAGISTITHPHAISSDGRWIFFSTTQALVARDTNGKVDAYEYDTQTEKISLVSSGRSSSNSFFQGASPNGHDVFFVTREQLVHADTDGDLDVYDARVNGGLASQSKQPAPPCEGESCQPPPVVPNDPTPASAAFSGQGNQRPRKPPRKRRHHHKQQHKRHVHSTRRHG